MLYAGLDLSRQRLDVHLLVQRWASWLNGLLTERAKEVERREAAGDDD